MRSNHREKTLRAALLGICILLLAVGNSFAQQQINLTAAPTTTTLPDGSTVPMWGYSCGATVAGSLATCAPLNASAGAGWSPVVITVPAATGSNSLQINLTNSLSFANGNSVPTSLVIVGQLGGGLGDATQRTTTASPNHSQAQSNTTWPIVGTGPTGTPPSQSARVQSFSTEVPAGATAVPLTWNNLRPGTYLIESGTHPSIQGPMGLYGILVVTTKPSTTAGLAYPVSASYPTGVTYDAEVPLLFGEIDPAQNAVVSAVVNTAGFSETKVWSGLPGGCGNPASGAVYNTCYPPVVNYKPLYFLINGVAFTRTAPSNSLFATSPATIPTTPLTGLASGRVLVRLVNAGLRMHVPSIVGAVTGTTAASGITLIAEDGNVLPGVARVQSEVFMAAGKTYDVMVNGVAAGKPALPVYDRELSLSGNRIDRDAGMLAYVSINGGALPAAPVLAAAVANADTYNSVVPGQTLSIADPNKGVIANDVNVYGVKVSAPAGCTNGVVCALAHGSLVLNADGTFAYTPDTSWGTGTTSDTFTYQANGTGPTALVTLNKAAIEAGTGITMGSATFTSNVATYLKVAPPGVLTVAKDGSNYPLNVDTTTISGMVLCSANGNVAPCLEVQPNGGIIASVPTHAGTATYTFTFKAKNSQGTQSATAGTINLVFPAPSNLAVTVVDGTNAAITISDYRWLIEEDRTFYVDPKCTTNPPPAGCPSVVPTFGVNFHTSYMPIVAQGCTGTLSCESGQSIQGVKAVCDVGNGICRTDATQQTAVLPSQVSLDPTKRYYISILPGDAGNPFANGYTSVPSCATSGTPNASCGHGMGGASIAIGQTAVTVLTEPSPYKPSKLSVFVFEDDFPLNGENDAGGGIDVLSPVEPGLGGFNITLFDDAGGTGDATGQMTYDMFNMPLSNALAGTPDPANHNIDACPISKLSGAGVGGAASPTGITSTIVTCPKYEADGVTLSPLAGQAVVANLMPGRFGVVATPAADRIARGEEWLQTNTLDGQKAHDSFLRIGEPSYFQEFGPAGYHVSIGFANPKIINSRLAGVCNGTDPFITGTGCTNTVTGLISTMRMSRTPDERLYPSGSNDSFAFTQCYVSMGDPDGEDFAFTKCDATGHFKLTGIPSGSWRITVFDQWNDMLVDGLSTPVALTSGGNANPGCPGPTSSATVCDLGQIATNQWQSNIYTQTFFDLNGNGIRDANEDGLALVHTNVRFRDGSFSNRNNTDLNGVANFNEVFPLFSWYVVETDTIRFKSTGTHVVYDAGGPADGAGGGSSTIGKFLANTLEAIPLPSSLRVPGAYYCADADCSAASGFTGTAGIPAGGPGGSTGRIDPPWVTTEGWQGFSGQNSFIEFGMKPFVPGETGGIRGKVVYASTRPFDDPYMLVQNTWEPLVPGVTINLYKEGTAPDGTTSLTLVDTTITTSFDNWAQGFRTDGNPNMSCPGQGRDTGVNADLFFFSIYNQPDYLDTYSNTHSGTPLHTIPFNSQFKCYDGMHTWNQVQPAPYDGLYQFPSVTGLNPTTGKPTGTNCTVCTANPDTTDAYRSGTPMLPAGKYVVEVVVPPGYELVKEEDKNILIGDNFIAPVTQQFASLGYIFILPDQASVAGQLNASNPQNSTLNLGATPYADQAGTLEQLWPCVGQARIVPDFISLFPQSKEVSPFAGATRNLCDRKEVTLNDQMSAVAAFYIFTSTHAAAHFTGVITDDFTSEFDPFSPQFGEKFAPPDLPISLKDFNGNETSRVYADHWGAYNGLTYSTWEVNPPNPTGYSPTMMVTCMNDPGPIPDPAHPGQTMTDPLYQPAYSQFCYELPFMPGQTAYLDTPVVPVSAFAGAGYNNVDCSYPDATPAVSEVDGDGVGPWVSAAGHTLTITSLGDQPVNNFAYSGPQASTPPFNQKTVTHHYGFGATAGTVALVGADGVSHALTGVAWSDTQITGVVPTGVPNCAVQQQAQYAPGATTAQCGELVITAANGKQSIDSVTVTIGGKAPVHIAATATIQSAIDAASPGDLLIVDPTCSITTGSGTTATNTPAASCTTAGVNTKTAAAHNEMLLMWKPLRLQGVGAATSIINANTQPAGKIDPWRRQVVCLFGLALNGTPITATNPYDAPGGFTCSAAMNFAVDRLPLEAAVGWDATLSGNLAELLQEPTLMGAYEGAAVTVLGKGVNYNGGDPYGSDVFPTGTTLLTGTVSSTGAMSVGDANALCHTSRTNTTNPYPSNFMCNPSRVDGLTISDSSQGGGGIFAHGWNHNLEIANNRVRSNTGTLSGGISIGQGEFPGAYLGGAANVTTNAAPGSCESSNTTNLQLPYCFNLHVNVHHNNISNNSSIGDELYSATNSGPGGIAFCDGADYYKFNYNWVCGNFSSGDGGGMAQLGFSYNADIEHNSFLFNQSLNPTIPTNGGGLLIHGTPDVDPTCGGTTDADCAAPGLSDGTGPNMVINANLFQGNAAEAGSGGGIRFQGVNGSDVVNFPTTPAQWYSPLVTNNIIVNNVAGWDGGGVSIQDALALRFINNTVMSNDSTASAGVLMNTLGAPVGAYPGVPLSGQTTTATTSAPQPAGLVAIPNSPQLVAALPTRITCPAGNYAGTTASNGTCRSVSYPVMANNVFWENRSFYIGVGPLGGGTINQQHVVNLYNAFKTTTAPTQPPTAGTSANGGGVIVTGGTGACTPGVSYWDLGVRGDTSPTSHNFSGIRLSPTYSVITDATDYATAYLATATAHNTGSNPTVLSQYCNGSRIAPENCATTNTPGCGLWNVPPGISDATVPNPIFSLMPAATVDEGNNWVNMTWGPLALTNPTVTGTDGNYGAGALLGNYGIAAGSPAINYIPSSATVNYAEAPTTDFYGTLRKTNNAVDAGAVEFTGAGGSTAVLSVAPTPLAFGNVAVGNTPTQTLTLTNGGTGGATGIAVGTFPAGFSRPTGAAGGTCGTTLAAGANCTIIVQFAPTAATVYTGSVAITANVAVTGSPVSLSGTGLAVGKLTFALTGAVPAGVSIGNSTILGVTVPTLLFGLQTGANKVATVSVTNTGGAPVIFTSATFTNIANTVFAQTNNCPIGGAGLAVNASCTLTVTMTPPTTLTGVTRTSYYTFTDNGVGSPQVLGVTGR